jgi:malate permease and related proteins
MFADLWPIVSRVLGVFLVMAIGAVCRKTMWLTRESDRSLANLTSNVLLPALFVDRVLAGDKLESLGVAWIPPAVGYVSTAIGFLMAWGFVKAFGSYIGIETENKQRSFALCVGVCNYGYIPLPLAQHFFPDAEVDLILHNVGVDLALWSVGLVVISGSAGGGWARSMRSPPVIAVVVALLLKHLAVDQFIPEPVMQAIAAMGDCSIPLGLLLSGAIIVDYFHEAQWQGSFRTVAASILLRQALFPACMLGATMLWISDVDLRHVMMLQAAMPAAVFPIVMVRLFERDTGTALRVVLSTSLAGVVLIPFWMAIGKLVLSG